MRCFSWELWTKILFESAHTFIGTLKIRRGYLEYVGTRIFVSNKLCG